jgi:hypothetical protein
VRSEVLTAVNVRIVVSWVWRRVVSYVDIIVSEEPVAFIFRVEEKSLRHAGFSVLAAVGYEEF